MSFYETAGDGAGMRKPFGLIANEPEALAIARRLAGTGHRVLHTFLDAAAGTPLSRECAGVLEAATPLDIAIACEVIALAIDDTARLRELLLGTKDRPGAVHDMSPGSVIIDFGIRPPREAQSLLGVLGMRGIGVIDAALIGGTQAIERGTASVLAGGFPEAVDTAMPLLAELGQVERTGPLGSAQTAAALMGYVEASHFAARSDALTFGKALGLRAPALSRILSEAPPEQNIVRFNRGAALVRALAEERGASADVIDLNRTRPAAARGLEAATPGESG